MKKQLKMVAVLLVAAMLLSGCSLLTMDELYCPPKRSEDYDNLQTVIDKAMRNLSYCAPVSGDNPQAVQTADLDGDGVNEYLLFAKDSSDMPLKILIFCQLASGYVLMDTIEGYGFAFEFVKYVQMDDRDGLEIVVSRQVSEELPRSVSVYRFSSGFSQHLLSVSCNKMLVDDLDADGCGELLMLTSSESEWDQSALMMYDYDSDSKQMSRASVAHLPWPASALQRMEIGLLTDGAKAVFVTSSENDANLTVDIFTLQENRLTSLCGNIKIPMIHNYPVYPADIDEDGIMELAEPILLPKYEENSREQYVLHWYALDHQGQPIREHYTYHNFSEGWHLTLVKPWVQDLTVVQTEEACVFYLYDQEKKVFNAIFSIVALTGSDREEQAEQMGRTVLYKSESVIYVVELKRSALDYGVTAHLIQERFRYIRMERNNNESGE